MEGQKWPIFSENLGKFRFLAFFGHFGAPTGNCQGGSNNWPFSIDFWHFLGSEKGPFLERPQNQSGPVSASFPTCTTLIGRVFPIWTLFGRFFGPIISIFWTENHVFGVEKGGQNRPKRGSIGTRFLKSHRWGYVKTRSGKSTTFGPFFWPRKRCQKGPISSWKTHFLGPF